MFDADFKRGFELGKAYRPTLLRAAAREPVAYLYNGVQLPPLPDWDRNTHPVYFIYKLYNGGYRAIFMDSVTYTTASLGGSGWYVSVGKPDFYTDLKDGKWGSFSDNFGLTGSCDLNTILWANFDVLNKDGSVYLPTSTPVPVYE